MKADKVLVGVNPPYTVVKTIYFINSSLTEVIPFVCW